MPDVFTKLIEAGVLAPSGDNRQPWEFAIDKKAQTIRISLNKERASDFFDPEYRFAFLAFGAVVENMSRVAVLNGLEIEMECRLQELSVLVHVKGLEKVDLMTWQTDPLLRRRVTNRLLYDGRRVDERLLPVLRQREFVKGIQAHWVVDKDKIDSLANLIRRSDTILFGVPDVFEAFVDRVEFEASHEEVALGMPVDALGARGLEKYILQLSSLLPRWVMPNRLGGLLLGLHARDLVKSASGLCILTTSSDGLSTAVHLGRAMEHLWLQLTAQGLMAQPMGSLYILGYLSTSGTPQMRKRVGRIRVKNLLQEFTKILPETKGRQLAFVLRFGYADPPPSRPGRLPLKDLIEVG